MTNVAGESKLKITKGLILNAGTNYTAGFDVAFSGGSPSVAATAKATLSVTSITLTNNGDSYSAAPSVVLGVPDAPVSFPGGLGGAATATASAATIGSINSFSVTNAGTGYTGTSFVIIKDATGRGAEGSAVLTATIIDKVMVLDGGKNYTATPNVTISGGGGSGATATAILKKGIS